MKTIFCTLLFSLSILYSCVGTDKKKVSDTDSLGADIKSISPGLKSNTDDRYSIIGDFNGDKIPDTLFESYISALTNSETTKIPDSNNWENNISLIIKNKPITRLYTNLRGIDTFVVSVAPQQSGLFHFRNLGDLNADGKDEIGYAIQWADYSNINTYYVITLDGKRFIPIMDFRINEALLYDHQEGLFENNELIKPKDASGFWYKFYSDSASVEIGEYTFRGRQN